MTWECCVDIKRDEKKQQKTVTKFATVFYTLFYRKLIKSAHRQFAGGNFFTRYLRTVNGSRLLLLFDKSDDIAYRFDVGRNVVGNGNAVLVFKAHEHFDNVERVCAEIFYYFAVHSNGRFINV